MKRNTNTQTTRRTFIKTATVATIGVPTIIPAIALGILIGIRIVNLIPEREFRYFIMIMTFLKLSKVLLKLIMLVMK